ncbi:MAG: COX15/CtaA family protein [Acidimicrobiales bacterium]
MRTVGPARYRSIVTVAWALLATIVVTGALVRLTDAGLGCDNWPICSQEHPVPQWELHGWIEFGNRLFTGAVAVAVALAVLTAYRRRPFRRDLLAPAWAMVAGVAAQVIVGAVVVFAHLHPATVGLHFLISMALLWAGAVAWVRAGSGGPPTEPAVQPQVITTSRVALGLAVLVMVLGTAVTGTGPNSGDARADRLPFELTDVTRIHSVAVWLLLAAVVALAVQLQRHGPESSAATARLLVAAVVVQGGIGYLQFTLSVPPALVMLHLIGSMVVWDLLLVLHLRLWHRPPMEPEPNPGPDPLSTGTAPTEPAGVGS